MPVCERCRRRKIEDQCVYHPGPMRGAASNKQNRPSNRVRKSKETDSRGLPGVDALRSLTGMRIVSPQDPGFLGRTSHTAILREDLSGIALNAEEPYLGVVDSTEPLISGIGSRRLEEAVAVLRLLRSFDLFERVLLTWTEFEMYTSMIEYFVADCTRSVKADLIAVTDLASDDVLEHKAKCLFENTCHRPTIPRTCTMDEFQKFFTGASMRWETVGVLFTACGIICCALAPSDPIFRTSSLDKHGLLRRLYEASSASLSFCEAAGALSDLGLWLHIEHTRLSSQVLGYTHYLVWNHLGATTNHIVSQGLHINTEMDSGTPPWLVEMRRRGVACVYVFDKVLCRFCGRPPRLSQRYCTIHVPLDIAVSDLAELATGAPLNSISGSGWNIKGPQEKAYLRCLVMSSRLTEEVLELSLGPPQSDLQSRVVYVTRGFEPYSLLTLH
jgi:chromatin structure-remodeling complex subunit RSC3/30